MAKIVDTLLKRENIPYLQDQGLINPLRVKRLIEEAIGRLSLDLRGMVVFTEAANRNYVVTPIIAALAGASKVYAITADSRYGSVQQITDLTESFAEFCGVSNKIRVIYDKKREFIEEADIITNLGFVRPIDESFIEMMKDEVVIPYMCEAWEFRKSDIDLNACLKRRIPVMATDEDHRLVDVFKFSGPLCMKMLYSLEVEIYKSKIAIISRDKFGQTAFDYLKNAGADVGLFDNANDREFRIFLENADALVVADYKAEKQIIGRVGDISADELSEISPSIAVVQFCGGVDIKELRRLHIPYAPDFQVSLHRMGQTLADLGPKPIIDLHTAGLKIGEAMKKAKIIGYCDKEFHEYVMAHSPAQLLTI